MEYQRVYQHVPGNGESVENYIEGGYHPMHIGDLLDDRYWVVRKLGQGRFATVWLALDREQDQYCALKVNVSEDSQHITEESLLRLLGPRSDSTSVDDHPTPLLLDAFSIDGPNGRHRVLVMEVLGTNMIEHMYDMQYWAMKHRKGPDAMLLKTMTRRMVFALAHVHATGIVHQDVQMGNFLLPLRNMPAVEDAHYFCENNPIFRIRRVDEAPLDAHCPIYIAEPLPFKETETNLSPKQAGRLKISDFGAACPIKDVGASSPAYPVSSRAPEVILDRHSSMATDVWALGCVMYRLLTGTDLIWVDGWKTGEEQDDENMQAIIEVLGSMPSGLIQRWKGQHKFLNEDGTIKAEQVDDPFTNSLDDKWEEFRPSTLSESDAADFLDLIKKICVYDPKERPTAEQILQFRWFQL